ncbi:hypothetical protein RDI58_020075 [Solanum bulbocastanum]|uniref:Uncharacterized protein n=1 Tax=Solanum bulbocastanum TaxID=147425 RepID=A0AAN8T6I9_SOLBU
MEQSVFLRSMCSTMGEHIEKYERASNFLKSLNHWRIQRKTLIESASPKIEDKISKIVVLKTDISRKYKDTGLFSRKNSELTASAKETIEAKCSIEEELLEKRKRNLNGVTSEKEDLHREILMFKTKLETAQSLAEESEEISIEAKGVELCFKLLSSATNL